MAAEFQSIAAQVQVVVANAHIMLIGTQLTLQLAAISIVFGTLIGIVGGLGLSYGPLPIRMLVRGYVELLRGLPLLVTIFVSYYGLPLALGIDVDPFSSVVFALSIFAGAQMVEIVRGAVISIQRNQTEAAKAIGLTFVPRMRYVILPQAFRRALPPWVNLSVDVVKGTSLCALVSISDLLLTANHLIETTTDVIAFY